MYAKEQIRVRIAPSPTGPLHLGTAKTALFNYLFAKKHQGKFVLRIEDTDKERSKEEFTKDIVDNLKWLGLDWDEGPIKQSDRTAIYKKYIKKLLDSKDAFYCYHTKEELEAEKNEQMAAGLAPKHVCSHYGQKPDPSKKGIIRFRCLSEKIYFTDLIRGKLRFDTSLLGDISIAKDENTPLFQISVVVDDAEMNITHVIRGEDHISNTPKQILIQRALGLPTPEYAHVPLILGTDKSKLSKRDGAVSMSWYREEGYLPEAIINFAVFLGWNPGTEKEIFSMEELIKEFSLERVQKGGAIFNINRLDWLNGYYIRKTDLDTLTKLCLPYLPKADYEFLKSVVALEQERMKRINEISALTDYFFKEKLDYQDKLLAWKENSLTKTKKSLELASKILEKADKFDQKSLESLVMPEAEKHGVGELLWPLRVALSGLKTSPGPFELASVLGKEKTLKRLKEAIEKIK